MVYIYIYTCIYLWIDSDNGWIGEFDQLVVQKKVPFFGGGYSKQNQATTGDWTKKNLKEEEQIAL